MHRRTATVIVLPVFIVALSSFAATSRSGPPYWSKWDESHDPKDVLSAARPECPQHWGSVPLFVDTTTGRELLRTSRQRGRGPGIITQGGAVYFTTGASASGSGPAGPIANVAGPKTNIPEFHDCQKFVRSPQQFDSLFAIFASFRLDSVVNALWDSSVTWSSSDPSKATVSATGNITAVAAGAASITATTGLEPSRQASIAVQVVVNQPPPGFDTVTTAAGSLTLGPGQSVQAIAEIGKPVTSTHAAAAIYSYGPGYPALGIKANFSCLYLYPDNSGVLRAKVIHVPDLGSATDACFGARNPSVDPGAELRVVRVAAKRRSDQAAVARWDWDPVAQRHYIGIKCGMAWCELGSRNSPFTPSLGHKAALGSPLSTQRVIENKGWYDEQDLAMPGSQDDPGRPGKKRLIPSGIKGTIIPDPALGQKDSTDFVNPWTQAAYIALDVKSAKAGAVSYYETALNLRPARLNGDLKSLNQLAFCFGTREHCGVPSLDGPRAPRCGFQKSLSGWENNWFGTPIARWWVRITAAPLPPGATTNADTVRYKCVMRRGHEQVTEKIPTTARWRWLLGDDTTWTECVQGCCEIKIGDN